MVNKNFNFPVSVKIIYEAESKDAPYVAYAPELEASSCGLTEEKARKNLLETIQIVFEEAERKGKINELLEEVGFRRHKKTWFMPRVSFQQAFVSLKNSIDLNAQNFSCSLS